MDRDIFITKTTSTLDTSKDFRDSWLYANRRAVYLGCAIVLLGCLSAAGIVAMRAGSETLSARLMIDALLGLALVPFVLAYYVIAKYRALVGELQVIVDFLPCSCTVVALYLLYTAALFIG